MKKIISLVICAFIITAAVIPAAAKVLNGDVNLDGEVDNKDVVTLFRYVSAGNKAEDESIYDYNKDNEVDNKDVVALFRFLSSAGETEETEEEIIVPDKTLTYFDADVYADEATAKKEGFKVATNNLLSKWFADKVELDPVTWDPVAPAGFDKVGEIVIRVTQGKYLEDVLVMKAVDKDAIDTVSYFAEYRWQKQTDEENSEVAQDYKLYAPEVFNERKESGIVCVIGDFVVYALTEDTETSILRAKKFVFDNPDCTAADLYKAIVIEENS